jgi:hypothetical protein
MSLSSRKSPILSSLTTRRKHHIHTAPTDTNNVTAAESEKRERPFGDLKYESDTKDAKPVYKSIFSL